MLNQPSLEQKKIIDLIDTQNIKVDAVAGSGKTTTNLLLAKQYQNKEILVLTYNKDLKLDARNKCIRYNINNLEAHSFHSFCVKYYYPRAFDDNGIIYILKNNLIALQEYNYDIIVVDEVTITCDVAVLLLFPLLYD